ncbi:GNAT family N-acetyltransferase [Gramella sp. MAR_2010_147]|uniref:GNAT family N-acetyltransferase n=1 Tax=Gramella sp. MAR_2010_147 TaxID=1250205 RepID=UPI00087DCF56|nr:GNAT family N-acetyltransferase [Gramella sp. MAR_2010_147]SDR72400.1 ribosomal-protein-alanine N-acetyltransferase [Gramella sp. MAR_2010_147]
MKNINFPKFETERLLLRKIKRQDQSNIHKGLSHKEVIRYYGVQYGTFEDTEEQINWYENLEKSGSGMWWAIYLKNSNEFCGAVGYNDHNKEHNKAEIGFWLLPDYWGNGFIKEAAEIIIEYLFHDLKIHRLEAYVESENRNSAKVLDKLAFKLEGSMQDCEVKKGKYISIELFAKINSEE